MSVGGWSHRAFAALTLLGAAVCIRAATHDELPQCGLSGVYKARQSVIESPNYPNPYPPNTCWDYVVRSPYRCPTKFHIQFLDFRLESSPNCTNDYLAIGLENDGDDMDLLCGQVIGIKKYRTPDGILRLRFFADDSPWSTGRGFKLLVTRLACEREHLLTDNLDPADEDTVQVSAPALELQPPYAALAQMFRNLSESEQYKPQPTPPLFGWNLPGRLPLPPSPLFSEFYALQVPQPSVPTPSGGRPATKEKPCAPTQTTDDQQLTAPQYAAWSNRHNQQTPLTPDQYASTFQPQPQPLLKFNDVPAGSQTRQQIDSQFGATPTAQHCCTSSFHQKQFYLSSPGFPRTAFTSLLPTQQRDCLFLLEKHSHNVCRLRIEFKFFDFGQANVGNGDAHGAISSTRNVCTEDFLEVNSERFCGCRTGFVHTTRWGLGGLTIRMRMGYAGIPSSGFLVEIIQEECHETAFVPPQPIGQQNVGTNFGTQPAGGEAGIGGQLPAQYPLQQTVFGQQQLPIYPQQAFYPPPPAYLPQQQQQQQPQQQQPQQAFFGSNLQSPSLQQFWAPPIQFGLPPQVTQFRQGRMSDYITAPSATQPVTVVETNSTRKAYYYLDADEAFARARLADEPDDPDRMGAPLSATPRDRCSFSTMDALRLTVDPLWITKPTCYAPLRDWFSNVFG